MGDVANMNIVITSTVDQANRGIESVGKNLANTAIAATKVDSSLAKSVGSTNTAAFALQNLGRVAQDAPFGFIAIQNNLNPLLESFQRLKAESGSTGGALKALAGTLTGPAGVGIALSVISSALVLYSQHAQQAKKTTNDFLDAIAESSAALNTELTKMSALVQVVRDSAESQEVRNDALKELQKIYPGYLNNLSLDNANTKVGIELVNALADALERKSKVQAYANLLTKSQEDLIKAQNGDLRDNLSFLDKVAAALKSGGNASLFVSGAAGTAAKNQADAIDLLQKKVSEYSKVLSDLTQEQAKSGDFVFNPEKIKKTKEKVEDFSKSLQGLLLHLREMAREMKDVIQPPKQVNILSDFFAKPLSSIEAENALVKMRDALQQAGKKVFSNQGILSDVDLLNDDEVKKNFDNVFGNMAKTAELIKGAFDGLFDSIANGENVFHALGNAVKKFVSQLISAVIEAAVLSLIMNALFPGSGNFSFGAIFSALSGIPKGPPGAAGGIITSPTMMLVGESGPERITPLSQLTGASGNVIEGNVVFEISGSKLRGVLKRADSSANTFQ